VGYAPATESGFRYRVSGKPVVRRAQATKSGLCYRVSGKLVFLASGFIPNEVRKHPMTVRSGVPACVACAALVLATHGDAAPAASPSAQAKAALDRLAAYRLGAFGEKKSNDLEAAERLVLQCAGSESERKGIAQHMAGMLGSANATPDCKGFLCRLLRVVGGAEEVPALAALLGDEKLSFMARYALGRMECPEAGDALRKALGDLKGPLLVGTIHAIGDRGDAPAVVPLARLARAPEVDVAAAAVAALGKIGAGEALAALNALPAPADKGQQLGLIEARLLCAHRLADGGKTSEAVAVFKGYLAAEHPAHARSAGLRGLARAPSIEWLDAVLPLLPDPKLKTDAAFAVVALGEKLTAADARVVAALKKISEETQNAELRARAAEALKKLSK
jgi:HEAT repeat protein